MASEDDAEAAEAAMMAAMGFASFGATKPTTAGSDLNGPANKKRKLMRAAGDDAVTALVPPSKTSAVSADTWKAGSGSNTIPLGSRRRETGSLSGHGGAGTIGQSGADVGGHGAGGSTVRLADGTEDSTAEAEAEAEAAAAGSIRDDKSPHGTGTATTGSRANAEDGQRGDALATRRGGGKRKGKPKADLVGGGLAAFLNHGQQMVTPSSSSSSAAAAAGDVRVGVDAGKGASTTLPFVVVQDQSQGQGQGLGQAVLPERPDWGQGEGHGRAVLPRRPDWVARPPGGQGAQSKDLGEGKGRANEATGRQDTMAGHRGDGDEVGTQTGTEGRKASLDSYRHGVKDDQGDVAIFLPSFLEDPWKHLR